MSAARRDSRKTARILHVVLSLTPGGTERLVIDMCRRLAEDFEVTVCCLDEKGPWAGELESRGIEVLALRRRPGFRPGVGGAIARLAESRNVALLHCHQYSPFVYGRIAKFCRPELKLVYTEHGRFSDAAPSLKRRLVNPFLARFDGAIVAVSDELRDYMIESRFPAASVGMIHNGIDAGAAPSREDRLRARRMLGFDDDQVVLATVARLDPVKDLHTLLEALAIARGSTSRPLRLLIVGDGPERTGLETRAAQADLAGVVSFAGLRSDVRSLLPAADIYVNSSISEGVSVTILEAMASGVPVIATAAGGTPEVLREEAAGILVPVRNREALAAAIVDLSTNRHRRSALAAAGRRRVESAFTVDRMVREYQQLYHRLLN